jgi:hypothetical protein
MKQPDIMLENEIPPSKGRFRAINNFLLRHPFIHLAATPRTE